ncbi:hypothetical protein [Actinomadura rubrisoli]|nr:hypothetical protein [Actinomadura rubrisoli]
MTEQTEPIPPEPPADAGPTEMDEEDVLRGLYGPSDGAGIFREVSA